MRSTLAAVALSALMTLAATNAGAQQEKQHEMKKGESHEMMEHHSSPWKEMDAFHATLGTAFHPVEKGDFAPLKGNAAMLAAKAKLWQESTPPAACATPASRDAVAWLATSTAKLADQVKSGAPDSELKVTIAGIHDRFETVEKSCGASHDMKGMKH